ncbi:MAG: ferritin-like domain-containing protein [Alphaproteobacteria bacterium]|nr:ferritin-like domain-containing protein [Alphaproteobacteria bacterium]
MLNIPTDVGLPLRPSRARAAPHAPPLRELRATLLVAALAGAPGCQAPNQKPDEEETGEPWDSWYEWACSDHSYTLCTEAGELPCEEQTLPYTSSPPGDPLWVCDDAQDAEGPAFDWVGYSMYSGCEVQGLVDSSAEICAWTVYCRSCCGYGRPYMREGVAALAELRPDPGWRRPAPAPALSGLDAEQRRALAAHWAKEGLAEHSSVAGFHRFALDLMAHGAPPALIEGAQRAAAQELAHTQLCFSLASAYAGQGLGPGPLPLGSQAPVAEDLAQLAEWTALEGALGETVACWLARAALAQAEDPAVRAALSRIVTEETEHAELAWATLRWALDLGGAPVRQRLQRAFADPVLQVPSRGPVSAALRAHGVLDEAQLRAEAEACLREVVRPVAASLLSAPGRRAA